MNNTDKCLRDVVDLQQRLENMFPSWTQKYKYLIRKNKLR